MAEIVLLGHPVGHSLSPSMHNAAFAALGLPFRYVAQDVVPGELERALRELVERGARGANVTIPHKQAAVVLCNELDEFAHEAGAVNTLVFEQRRIFGSNTDVLGILQLLGNELEGARVVILGGGGAARAAVVAARRGGATEILRVARTGDAECAPWTSAVLLRALAGARVLINASAMGMNGAEPPCAVPVDVLPADACVFDFVYQPRETPLLAAARQRGLRTRTIDGLELLLAQGTASFRAWTGHDAPMAVMRQALGLE